jgi:hypothetical protein
MHVHARPGRDISLGTQHCTRDLTKHLANAHPGSRAIALLAAERKALPVSRLKHRAHPPRLFGKVSVLWIEIREPLRVWCKAPSSRISEAFSRSSTAASTTGSPAFRRALQWP